MGLSADDVEGWTLQSNTRTELRSNLTTSGNNFISPDIPRQSCWETYGEGWAAPVPFQVISKAVSQHRSSHLENGTICKTKEVFSFTIHDNL